jgi:hypothetical protein
MTSLWRLADDASGTALRIEPLLFRGAHEGYLRLDDPVRLVRTISFDSDRHRLTVSDEPEAEGSHRIEVPIHLAPGVEAALEEPGAVGLLAEGRRFRLTWEPSDEWTCTIGRGWIAETYGVETEIVRVEFHRDGTVRPLLVTLEPM